MTFSLKARMTAEFVGTALLLAAVVGSGIMGDRLSGGNVAIALLANTIATGAALVALILTFGDGELFAFVERTDGGENLLHQKRRQAERGFVEQDELRPRHQRAS